MVSIEEARIQLEYIQQQQETVKRNYPSVRMAETSINRLMQLTIALTGDNNLDAASTKIIQVTHLMNLAMAVSTALQMGTPYGWFAAAMTGATLLMSTGSFLNDAYYDANRGS